MKSIVEKKWQYFPSVALIVVMIFGCSFFYYTLSASIQSILQDHLSNLVDDVIYEIQEDEIDFQSMDPEAIDTYIGHLTQASASRRITILSSEGRVLGDTTLAYRALAELKSYADKVEITDALEKGYGFDMRYSASFQVDTIYLAKPVKVYDHLYLVRITLPLDVLEQLSIELMTILISLMVASGIVLIVTTYLSHLQIEKSVETERSLQDNRIEQRTYEIELLHRLANMLAACNSIQEAQNVVQDIVPRILGEINGSVAIIRASRNQLTIKLDWGKPWPAAKSYAPDECWALRKGKHHLSNDGYHNLPCAHMSELGDDQTLCVPLNAHGNTIGMMHLYFGHADVVVGRELRQLAFTVAEHLGLALANLTMQEKLRAQAVSDPLTGLYNRRYFEETMNTCTLQAKRYGTQLSLLMLDLDHFKRFNDNFGHDAGDYVLKSISTLLVNSVGDDDVVCRLGGEELGIILPNSDEKAAIEMADRICLSVRELHLELKGLSLGKLSTSIGISTYPDNSMDIETLIKFADTALYDAKDSGRDQAIHYSSYQRKLAANSESNKMVKKHSQTENKLNRSQINKEATAKQKDLSVDKT